ncbi:palmitoleoyl-protein carboxylesterase notum1a [Trichonephila clavipes]|nr:palmitoleoyl-protein carboxylesterase notum1a [Trichonephila clavipes]
MSMRIGTKLGSFAYHITLYLFANAGGTGVLLNLDRVSDFLHDLKSKIEVRGLADSGWFLDNEPYQPLDCLDPQTCAPVEAIKRGVKYKKELKVNSEREQDSPVEMGASNISRFKEMPFLKAKRHRAHSVVSGVQVKGKQAKKKKKRSRT